VLIHGHSCFLQKIIRRAKLHAATPFVKFAQFAVFFFLSANGRSSESKRACSFCRVVTDEDEVNYPNYAIFSVHPKTTIPASRIGYKACLFVRNPLPIDVFSQKTATPVCAPREGATIGTRGFRSFSEAF
jgi:hypothetical protein